MVSVTQNSHHHRPLMVQAPVRALDPDGVTVVTAGTVAFAIGALACWWLLPELNAAGKGWYLGVSITGFVLGLCGLTFGLFRRQRRHRAELDDDLGADSPTPRYAAPDELGGSDEERHSAPALGSDEA